MILYSTLTRREGLTLVPAQSFLPIGQNRGREAVIESLSKGVRGATSNPKVLESRQQLFIFQRCRKEEATEYTERLWEAGMGSRETISEIELPCTNEHIRKHITKALSRWNAATNDIYALRGPVLRA